MGGGTVTLDVSVLGDAARAADISKHAVAEAADSSIAQAIACGSEHDAMNIMARGATRLARGLCDAGRIDGVIALGGTMGTDLALDVCQGLPTGLPKYVVSTVAVSARGGPGSRSWWRRAAWT